MKWYVSLLLLSISAHAEIKLDVLKIDQNIAYLTDPAINSGASDDNSWSKIFANLNNQKEYSALISLSSKSESGDTQSVLLSNLYSKYNLPQQAYESLANAHVTTSNMRGTPWLSYGKRLYENLDNQQALDFLLDPPPLLTAMQDAERKIMIANLYARLNSYNDSIAVLQAFSSPLYYYRKLARYNLALMLLKKNSALTKNDYSNSRTLEAVNILEELLKDNIPPLKPLISENSPDIKPRDNLNSEHKQWFTWYGLAQDQSQLVQTESSFQSLPPKFFKQIPASNKELNELNDQIALTLSNLYLLREEPNSAKKALLGMSTTSPNSNAAILTTAYINYDAGDLKKSFNYSNALIQRNIADPIVQEAYLLSASTKEDANQPEALELYKIANSRYEQFLVELNSFEREIENINILDSFPAADPISSQQLVLSDINHAGIWAVLLQKTNILNALQQLRLDQILLKRVEIDQFLLAKLDTSQLTITNKAVFANTLALIKKTNENLIQQESVDHDHLMSVIRPDLQQQRERLYQYTTDGLLGIQRLSTEHSSSSSSSQLSVLTSTKQ